MEFGELELQVVSDGTFRLDGGAMFGTVPKVLWEKTNPADERNRILLGLNCLLVHSGSDLVLVDTGLGGGYDEKFMFLYDVDGNRAGLLGGLAALDVSPEQVTRVVLTHLHFDHSGGNCIRENGEGTRPAFPNALYYVDAGELEYAQRPDLRSRASYLAHTWETLESNGQLVPSSSGQTVCPGVELLPAPGHTLRHQVVLARSGGRTACFLGDLVPTPSHLKIPYVMGYDVNPLETMKTKVRLLEQARRERWLLFFEHSPEPMAGYLSGEDLRLEPVNLKTTP